MWLATDYQIFVTQVNTRNICLSFKSCRQILKDYKLTFMYTLDTNEIE